MKKEKLGPLPIGVWRWWYMPVAFLLSLALRSVMTMLTQSSLIGTASQVLGLLLTSLLVVALGSLIHRSNQFGDFSILNRSLGSALAWGFGGGLVLLAVSALVRYLLPQSVGNVMETLKQQQFGQQPLPTIISILTVTVLGPVFEELFFRGLLFRSLRDGLARFKASNSKWVSACTLSAAILVGILFIVPHLGEQNVPLVFIGYLPMTIIYTWLFWKTGSLLTAMIAHTINNAIHLILGMRGIGGLQPGYYALALAGILITVLLGLAFHQLFKSRQRSDKSGVSRE